MRLKLLLASLVIGGIATGGAAIAGTSDAGPKMKPTKEQRDAAKAERKAVPVPEPSGLLLSALGMGGLLIGGWYFRRRSSEASRPD
jgi:hypothetical protein